MLHSVEEWRDVPFLNETWKTARAPARTEAAFAGTCGWSDSRSLVRALCEELPVDSHRRVLRERGRRLARVVHDRYRDEVFLRDGIR